MSDEVPWGIALEGSKPHSTKSGEHVATVALTKPSVPMGKLSQVEVVGPMFVELVNMITGQRYAVNPNAIKSAREFKLPLIGPDGKPKNCLRIDIEGVDHSVHVDMKYEELMERLSPAMILTTS